MTIPATATLVDLDALLVGANAAAARLAAIGNLAVRELGVAERSFHGLEDGIALAVPTGGVADGRIGLAASQGAVEALAEKGDALTSWQDVLSDVVTAIAGHVAGLQLGDAEMVDPAEGIGPAIDPAGDSAGVYLGDILIAAVGFVSATPQPPAEPPAEPQPEPMVEAMVEAPPAAPAGPAASGPVPVSGAGAPAQDAAVFQAFSSAADPVASEVRRMHLLRDVEMGVSVELGRTRMAVRDLLGLAPGAIVELDKAAGAPVDVLVNGTLMARGQVVVIDEEFAVRISEIVSPEQGDQLGA